MYNNIGGRMASIWNPWHGCHKKSEGCKYCYIYRSDLRKENDFEAVYKTKWFDKPIQKLKNGEYKIKKNSFIYTCFESDFLLEDADKWREEAWKIIKERSDCQFLFLTKRIERFMENIPKDWQDGYDNVTIAVSVENQRRVEERISIFKKLPIKHKMIICQPLIEEIDLSSYLDESIETVIVGGEMGKEARICNFSWILKIRKECIEKNVSFTFRQTGAKFMKDDKLYRILRKDQFAFAQKANINYRRKNEKITSRRVTW